MTDALPAALARQVRGRGEIAIRPARPGDLAAVTRLAQLSDRRLPAEPLLLAESDGTVVAVLSTATGEAVSDPFSASHDLLDLLRLRSLQLHAVAA